MKALRTLGMSALAVCAATFAVYAQTASAASYTYSGLDMRSYVSNSTPLMGCSSTSGYIHWTPVSVRAPSWTAVRVTVTNYLFWTVPGGGSWYLYNMPNGNSPNPNGVTLAPGKPFAFAHMYVQTPNGRYYYTYVRIDFFYPNSGKMMGTVFIAPNTTEDWDSTWLPYYDSNRHTYCYK
jgi:hypothetical protein